MKGNPSTSLKKLEKLKNAFGGGVSRSKMALLAELEGGALRSAKGIIRLHEVLCYMRANPDDRDVLERVEGILARFERRRDLRRHRKELSDTGIAGTVVTYRFFWFMARWLVRHWPDRLVIDWPDFDGKQKLEDILHLLVPYCETPGLDEAGYSVREWIDAMKGPDETDAAFLIRRFEALRSDNFGREKQFEDLDIPIRLNPGPTTPSRTREKYNGSTVFFQKKPLSRERPDLRRALMRPPLSITPVPAGEARKLIDMARGAMVTRSRDLDAFVHADFRDVRLVDCGRGLQFVCLGSVPERRLMLESVYGFLTLKNGVPTGYVLTSALFRSAAIAYNVFETFREAESAYVYGRILGMVRRLFGADAISVDPYQLGHDNDEGLRSGAWWFYYKLGFRPHDRDVRKILRRELDRMKIDPRHRSSRSTLQKLTAEDMFFYLRKPRTDVLGRIPLGEIGLAVTRTLAERFGSRREKGLRVCSREAARLLGVRSMRSFTPGERLAWERWSPLILSLPGVEKWSPDQKRALAQVARAKGGRRESDYVRLFDKHTRLKSAVLELAAGE